MLSPGSPTTASKPWVAGPPTRSRSTFASTLQCYTPCFSPSPACPPWIPLPSINIFRLHRSNTASQSISPGRRRARQPVAAPSRAGGAPAPPTHSTCSSVLTGGPFSSCLDVRLLWTRRRAASDRQIQHAVWLQSAPIGADFLPRSTMPRIACLPFPSLPSLISVSSTSQGTVGEAWKRYLQGGFFMSSSI